MKTLCLGGSFNPIHHGHLICARAAAEAAGFDRVLLIPTGHPPHKVAVPDLADAAHRLKMCELAINSVHSHPSSKTDVSFAVSDLELTRSGPSYTLDTVRELRRQGWQEVWWLIGADMLNYLPKWHKHADLLNEAQFIILARPGVSIDWASLPGPVSQLRNNVVDAPLIDISSTQIRQRVRTGLNIEYLTPSPVVDYIRSCGLYRASAG